MKLILRSILALAIAGSPLLAGQEPQEEKPKQEEKKETPKPKPEAKPKQEPPPEDKTKPKQEPKPKPDDKQQQKADQNRQKQEEKQPKANPAPNQRGQQAPERRARSQEQIPQERFRAGFGREHHFHVAPHQQRFQHGGYRFEVVQVWPAGWSFDDDCYIEEDADDYYLVDFVHPELRVLVIVVEG